MYFNKCFYIKFKNVLITFQITKTYIFIYLTMKKVKSQHLSILNGQIERFWTTYKDTIDAYLKNIKNPQQKKETWTKRKVKAQRKVKNCERSIQENNYNFKN